jgi:hypothetical protein
VTERVTLTNTFRFWLFRTVHITARAAVCLSSGGRRSAWEGQRCAWAPAGEEEPRHMLVEIGSEGGRRHNSPLNVLPPPKGKAAEGPPQRKAEKLSY